jgi:hypothetical protein
MEIYMNNYSLTKWLGGLGVIAGGGVLTAIIMQILVGTAEAVNISAKNFTNYQGLNMLLPVVAAVVFTVWWWRCVTAKKTIFTEEYRSSRMLNILIAAATVVLTEVVIVVCFVRFRNIVALIIAAIVSCVVNITAHIVSSMVFGEY